MHYNWKVIIVFVVLNLFFGISDQRTGLIIKPEPIQKFESERFANTVLNTEKFKGLEDRFNRFLVQWQIPGASVAIAVNGKIIYTKGFGYADTVKRIAAQPYSLYRLASVSKLITAIGVMKLVEEHKLSLDRKVFGPNGILNAEPYRGYPDPRFEHITVRNLLDHSGGWSTRWGDPMFLQNVIARQIGKPLPLTDLDFIQFALSRKLHFEPGTSSFYSNLGYVILGRVVEVASGMPYETYIRNKILIPLGIYDMCIGKSKLSEKARDEVEYYELPNAPTIEASDGSGEMVAKSDGGNNIEALGAAGGWIGSATDLLKLVLRVDGWPFPADILSAKSIHDMVTVERKGFSPLGWRKIAGNGDWIRTGSYAGTACVIRRMPNGVTFVVLANSCSYIGPHMPLTFAAMLGRELQKVDLH